MKSSSVNYICQEHISIWNKLTSSRTKDAGCCVRQTGPYISYYQQEAWTAYINKVVITE
jgi:hypothetical protein